MSIRLLAALGLLLAAASPGLAAGPAAPALRLVVEAEDFEVERGAWTVLPWGENYFSSTFAVTFLSRKACLSAPAQLPPGQPAVASLSVEIPRDGSYEVLARYEQPWAYSVEFGLEVEQDGRTAFRQRLGRLEAPKYWAFRGGVPEPMVRYPWGGGDNIVWQHPGSVRLRKGRAVLRLVAEAQRDGDRERRRAARRNVDVIVLTDDRAGMLAQKAARYLPFDGWLLQDGDLFARFTNPADAAGPVVPVVAALPRGQHSPYHVHVRDWPTTRVLRSGRLTEATSHRLDGPRSRAVQEELLAPRLDPAAFPTIPPAEHLAPGERSGWVPIGNVLDALNDSQWAPRAERSGRLLKEVDLELELAVPDGRGGLKPLRRVRLTGRAEPRSTAALEIPGDVARRGRVRTPLEALEWLRAEIEQFPKVGTVPKRLRIHGLLGFGGVLNRDDALGESATRLALALGSNTLTPADGPWVVRLGVPQRRAAIVTHWGPRELERRYARAERDGTLPFVDVVSFGDEIRIPSPKPRPEEQAAWTAGLREWLSARGEPHPHAAYTADPTSDWFFHSSLFAAEKGLDTYVEATRWVRERLSPDVHTGANFSPHPSYQVTDLQWVRPFRRGALTLPWSEDYVWQVPEPSPQVVGYLVSALRAGTRNDGRPILMYVMPHSPGNVPRDFRLSFYTALAHGAKRIHYFCATPSSVGQTENYVATDDVEMWRALHRATHEAGIFEDYVLDGRPQPARVALLLSAADELLAEDAGRLHSEERKALYYALRHAQVPVDLLIEDDVAEGRLEAYDLVYLTQTHLPERALQALSRWIERGGRLVASCGGGFLDERRRDSFAARALYGVSAQAVERDPRLAELLPKQDLPDAEPLGYADWAGLERVPALACRQRLTPSDAEVLGHFDDGSPAVLEKVHGRGRAVLYGFLPGLAYLQSGLPQRPMDRAGRESAFSHFLPTDFDAALRRALVDARLPPGFVRPVEVSEPLVEATLIEGDRRLAVPLANYTGTPRRIRVTIAGVGSLSAVRSVAQGRLEVVPRGGRFEVELPLDVADMLLIDR